MLCIQNTSSFWLDVLRFNGYWLCPNFTSLVKINYLPNVLKRLMRRHLLREFLPRYWVNQTPNSLNFEREWLEMCLHTLVDVKSYAENVDLQVQLSWWIGSLMFKFLPINATFDSKGRLVRRHLLRKCLPRYWVN